MTARLRGLIVDYGGVLTSPLQDTMSAWAAADDLDNDHLRAVMRAWLTHDGTETAAVNPVHALERGEMSAADFEAALAARLRTRQGAPLAADGLLSRMFAAFVRAEPMIGALRRARAAGIATALLSNSWGLDYPREGWDELFDAVVISGEVGMRKPEPAIYRLAADRLGLEPAACVFVDDLAPNVRGAVAVGMVGVHHVSADRTLEELEACFAVPMQP